MSNKKILLVSTAEIIANSPVQDNIDVKLLAKTLIIVQDTGLKQILGSTIYDELLTQVSNNVLSGSTIDTFYANLITVSKPYLIAKTTADFIIINNYKITDKGVLKMNDNSATNVSEGDLQAVKDYYDNLISTYKKDVIDYLSATNAIDNDNDIQITSDSTGWYFGIPVDICEPPFESNIPEPGDYIEPSVNGFTYQYMSQLNKVILINVDDIIYQSVIQDNVDVKLLSKTIETVQQVYLNPLLTDANYYGLLDSVYQYVVSGTTQPALYLDMMTFVKPYLINKVVAEFLIPNNYKVTNKGILKLNDNSATNISEGDLTAVKDYYDNISTTYKISLLEFLNKYGLIDCGDKDITSDATGWFLGSNFNSSGGNLEGITAFNKVLTNPTTPYLPYNNNGIFADSFLYQTGTTLFISPTATLNSPNNITINNNIIGVGGIFSNIFGTSNGLASYSVNIGYQANANATTAATQNVAIGYQSLYSATTGSFNTAIGVLSMANATGNQNAALGYQSLQNASGGFNTANGYRAARYVTGNYNTAVGNTAMANQTSGSNNTAIGYAALIGGIAAGSTGNNNTAIGYSALRLNVSGTSNVAIGYQAGENELGSNKLYIHNNNSSSPLIGGDFSTRDVIINSGLTITGLSGATTRMVVADTTGKLSTQTLTTVGDMLKSVYDIDNDGVVDTAEKIMIQVLNNTGAAVTRGQIVYIKPSSSSALTPEILLSSNTGETTSSKTIGAIYDLSIANGATGYTITNGEMHGNGSLPFDTSMYNTGDKLWLGSVPGSVTTTVPTQPNHAVFIGHVTRSQNVNGRVFYQIQNGFELNELHNVLISSGLTDNDILAYDAATSLWKNESISSAMVGSVTGGTLTLTSGLANTLVGFNANKVVTALSTAVYPSLIETTYVKGVTSAIQPQIDAKQADTAWVDCSSQSISGWATTTTKLMQYKLLGNKTAILQWEIIGTGTTSGNASMTLPFTSSAWGNQYAMYQANQSTTAIAICGVAPSSTILNFYANQVIGSAFSSSQSRNLRGQMIINIA